MTGRGHSNSTPDPGPTPWAHAGVGLAARTLPAGATRDRWRQEFRADLQVLGPRQQATYTVGVLINAWALRAALQQEEPTLMEKTVTTRPPLTCRLNLHHHWHIVSTEDGSRYKECRACHKHWDTWRPPGDWSPGF